MTLNEYQKLAIRTIPQISSRQLEDHAKCGMVGEIGEINSIYQKQYQGHEVDDEHLAKEVGDLMWFIAEFCYAKGWSLDYICEMNINKLKARYPKGFEVEKSIYREKGDI